MIVKRYFKYSCIYINQIKGDEMMLGFHEEDYIKILKIALYTHY